MALDLMDCIADDATHTLQRWRPPRRAGMPNSIPPGISIYSIINHYSMMTYDQCLKTVCQQTRACRGLSPRCADWSPLFTDYPLGPHQHRGARLYYRIATPIFLVNSRS